MKYSYTTIASCVIPLLDGQPVTVEDIFYFCMSWKFFNIFAKAYISKYLTCINLQNPT